MIKNIKRLGLLVLLVLASVFMVACGGSNNNQDDNGNNNDNGNTDNNKKEVSITVESVIMVELGDNAKINYTLVNGDEDKISITTESKIINIRNGEIQTKEIGDASVTIKYSDGDTVISKDVTVKVTQPKINVTFNGDGRLSLESNKLQKLDFTVDKNIDLEKAMYEFSSSNEEVATINSKGEVMTLKEGQTTITLKSKIDENIKFTYECNVFLDVMKIIESYNIEAPLYREVTTYGSSTHVETVLGSVNYYTPMNLNLIENIVPITTGSPYVGKTATEAMVKEADEACKYVRSGILHTETSKITYHDTGNNSLGANANMHAKYMVGAANLASRARSWHYTVDENCVIHHIPDEEVTWQGDTYEAYSTSIGIETCVDEGSDLEVTWHRTAKLMSSLLVKHNLDVTSIVQHYDWNKKDCPKTLRNSNLYGYAIEMIKAEYDALTLLKDYTISFTSLRPDLVNDNGHIIKLPDQATKVGYIVTLTDKEGNKQSKTLFSVIPGSDHSVVDENENANVDKFHMLLANVTKDNINDIVSSYNALTENEKKMVYGISYFISKIKETRENKYSDISIEEVCVDKTYRYKYFEIKNNTSAPIDLGEYSVKYTSDSGEVTLKLNSKEIASKATFIVFAGKNEDVSSEEVLYPDMALSIDLSSSGKIEILKGETVVDSVNYQGNVTRVSSTNNEKDDFLKLFPSALNSKGESYMVRDKVTEKVIETEVAILLIPSTVKASDADLINKAYELYNSLTKNEKNKVRNFLNLKSLKAQLDALA